MSDLEAAAWIVYDMLEGPVGNQDAVRQQRQWILSLDIADAVIKATSPSNGDPTFVAVEQPDDDNATRLLRQCYVTLAFAFNRLHQSPRSRDGALCEDFGKVRKQIEDHFKKIGVKL